MNSKLKRPIAIKWTIPEYRLTRLKNRPGVTLTSNWFHANFSGYKYQLTIFPNGDEMHNRGQTWIYLMYLGKTIMDIDVQISIPTANYFLTLVSECDGWGKYLFSTNELFDPEKRFIVGGKLTIKMQGTLMVNGTIAEIIGSFTDGHADSLCLGLWNHEESKDFTIVADGQKITVHKCVLATRSPVFTRMLQSGMKEAIENKVSIEDFTFQIVEKAIKSCYHKSLVHETSLEDKIKMLQFYDKYDIQPLKDELEAYMITVIDPLNICLLTNCSLLSNSVKLEKKCAEFLYNCLQKSKPIADFESLDKDFASNLMKNAFFQVSK